MTEPTVEVKVTATPAVPRASAPDLKKVEIASSEPPPLPRRRLEDRRWWWYPMAAFMWLLAPVVERWRGLSLTRFIAMGTFWCTFHLAHDWLDVVRDVMTAAAIAKIIPTVSIGWAFVTFTLGGFFLAVITALGAKHVDQLLTIVGAKLGVALVKAPVPGSSLPGSPE